MPSVALIALLLCDPGSICLEGRAPELTRAGWDWEYELEIPRLRVPTATCGAREAHIELLEAHIRALETIHRSDLEIIEKQATRFERKRAGLISGLSIMAAAVVSLVASLSVKAD